MNIGLDINGKDAKSTWGMCLTSGSLAALMTPPPMKERIVNKSRLQHGVRVVAPKEKVDERQLTLNVHFTAGSERDFLSRYSSFCEELSGGRLVLTLTLPGGRKIVYDTYYLSCSMYSQFYGGIAKFALKLTEPKPDQWAKR